jgi:hypothetical protein
MSESLCSPVSSQQVASINLCMMLIQSYAGLRRRDHKGLLQMVLLGTVPSIDVVRPPSAVAAPALPSAVAAPALPPRTSYPTNCAYETPPAPSRERQVGAPHGLQTSPSAKPQLTMAALLLDIPKRVRVLLEEGGAKKWCAGMLSRFYTKNRSKKYRVEFDNAPNKVTVDASVAHDRHSS